MSNSVADILKSIRKELADLYDSLSEELYPYMDREDKLYQKGLIDGIEKAIDIVDKIGKETM